MSSKLFSLFQIKSIILKNRIAISPMCQYSSKDGFANDWHLVHLGSRANGGAGLVMQEATAVSPEARISPEDLGLWKDEHIEKLRTITHFILEHHCVPGIQLAHAGRKASVSSPWQGHHKLSAAEGGWETFAPSAIGYHEHETTTELDQEGIDKVIADFRAASKRAFEAGYKVLELHGAHGYLLHQFLSPLSNTRTDRYGGGFENRIRFVLEIIEAVQQEWPNDLPLFVRISATDWAEGGWDIEESVKFSEVLKHKGVDLIDTSSGGLVPYQNIATALGYQVPFAEQIRKEAKICTGAVGLITEPEQAEAIIAEGKADLVFFARQSLRDPNLALTFAAALNTDVPWPNQYERAKHK